MISLIFTMFLCTLGRVIVEGGACSNSDVKSMQNAGGGHSAHSFPKLISDCARESIGIFSGFSKSKFDRCLVGKISLSDGCTDCFADYAQYGYDHCLSPCLLNWCASACLDCAEGANPALFKCSGQDKTTIPQPTVC